MQSLGYFSHLNATNAILETISICLAIQTFHHLDAHIQGDETALFSRQLLILRIQHCTLAIQYTLIEQSLHFQSYGDIRAGLRTFP